jgi:hypothetical protein
MLNARSMCLHYCNMWGRCSRYMLYTYSLYAAVTDIIDACQYTYSCLHVAFIDIVPCRFDVHCSACVSLCTVHKSHTRCDGPDVV